MPLDVGEFIRRFLLHVLPKDVSRIRHCGRTCQPPSCRQARPVLGAACPAGARAARTGIRVGAGAAPGRKGHHRLRRVRARSVAADSRFEGVVQDLLAGTQAKASAVTSCPCQSIRIRPRRAARPGGIAAVQTLPAIARPVFSDPRSRQITVRIRSESFLVLQAPTIQFWIRSPVEQSRFPTARPSAKPGRKQQNATTAKPDPRRQPDCTCDVILRVAVPGSGAGGASDRRCQPCPCAGTGRSGQRFR